MIPVQCHTSLQPLFTRSLGFFLFFFFLLKHPFPSLSLSEVCSSSHLQFSRVVHRYLLPPALSWRILPLDQLWMIPSPPRRPHLSLMDQHREFCQQDQVVCRQNRQLQARLSSSEVVDIYNSCISKARTIQKL